MNAFGQNPKKNLIYQYIMEKILQDDIYEMASILQEG